MATVELTNEQVVELVRQLPAEAKRKVLLALAGDAQARRGERMALAAEQLRRCAADRGMNWDTMSDEDREALVDDLIHEDRPCQP
jgi:acyl-CoA synthetase (NDP forming)